MSDLTVPSGRFEDEPVQPTAVAAPAKPGQATMVEQARAIAEVRASVMIAMDRPRDRTSALIEMREVCGITSLAERAFFRVPRGGQQINGESIHLARELARIWGNITYGVKELVHDDAKGQSELLAYAWDLQTNARSEIIFIVPHIKGRENRKLTGTQEIYENNASFAGRRLRETIFAILPVWFKEEAAQICHRTLEEGGGKPLIQRIADMRAAFETRGVSVAQLEIKRGRKIADFLAEDVAALGVIYRSIHREETTIADEFGPDQVVAKLRPGNVVTLERALAGKPPLAEPDDAQEDITTPATTAESAAPEPEAPAEPIAPEAAQTAPGPRQPQPTDAPMTSPRREVEIQAGQLREQIERLPTSARVDEYRAKLKLIDWLKATEKTDPKIAEEIVDAIEDRKTFLIAKERT